MASGHESNHSEAALGAFPRSALEIAETIPSGQVMTYGDIAAALGSRGARAVGTVMARHGASVAWWRVIHVTGHPPRGLEERALAHYRDEGTPLDLTDDTYRIDLARARYRL